MKDFANSSIVPYLWQVMVMCLELEVLFLLLCCLVYSVKVSVLELCDA